MEIKKYLKISNGIIALLSLILLGIAFFAGSRYIFTGIIFGVIALLMLVISLLIYLRLRTEDIKKIGTAGIQHAWGATSIGLAGASLFLAPFFEISAKWANYVAFVIAVIFMVIGITNLYKTREDTGQFLSI